MLVDFDSIPEDAKVWIYPSSRKFYANEIDEVTQKVKNFVENWKEEDNTFKASYKILYNRFIIITADDIDSTISNKDIDSSIAFILELQQTYNVVLLDKMNVCFKQGEFVQYKELKDFKKLLKNKAVTAKTIVFDNLVTTKHEFENYWEIAIEDSWYSRFLKK
ncbi:ABC transporter ATPase [Polaribacter aestuariivivens]|uniref:ABC transporter ATPase n=1 Tax=Polaribacter aestuariivivens TaxID=2304626 RepID=A0A5S3NCU5_9FLAO|nr:ABC transporter ATPase [Polaribacter aestuariivivens]TMM32424.1 ABC transporter ATPase [Polaribacter aestuariivivens]